MSTEDHGTTMTIDDPTAADATIDEPWAAKCPVMSAAHQAVGSTANRHWWPKQLNLGILRQNHPKANPMGEGFDYAKEFNSLDFEALTRDV
ncbi:MAG: hypothetical protein P8Y21_15490, partial [Gemmatimonadales bacterium]